MSDTNMNIKDAIIQYPQLGELLTAYGVDCVNCEIGTCKLSDVLNIHNFPLETENLINDQINDILGNKFVNIAAIDKLKIKHSEKTAFSQPLGELVKEHENILRLLTFAEYLISKEDFIELYPDKLRDILFYIKNYADKLHHSKEEDILFKTLSDNHEIINVMEQEHDVARGLVSNLAKSIADKDESNSKLLLTEYISLLRKHIKKEDEILYVWFQGILSSNQMEELARLFASRANKEIEENLQTFLYANYV